MTNNRPDVQQSLPGQSAVQDANRPMRASVRLSLGNSRIQADAEITPLGLLAVGGMVGAILLAIAPIVRAGGRTKKPV